MKFTSIVPFFALASQALAGVSQSIADNLQELTAETAAIAIALDNWDDFRNQLKVRNDINILSSTLYELPGLVRDSAPVKGEDAEDIEVWAGNWGTATFGAFTELIRQEKNFTNTGNIRQDIFKFLKQSKTSTNELLTIVLAKVPKKVAPSIQEDFEAIVGHYDNTIKVFGKK